VAAATLQDFQSLVLSCNKDGMDSLRKGQTKAAFEQFKYAEAILIANQAEGEQTSLLAVTCNNLGCYYKKVGKLHGALSYLRRALKMEVDLGTDEVTLAGTHLNICAILSKLEKHDKAVQHALCALDLINKRVSSTQADRVSQDDYSVLAIAYHNVAVERDFLHQYEKAAAAFQQGHLVAKRSLGEDHPLTIALDKNCDAILQKSKKLAKTSAGTLSMQKRVIKEDDLFKLTDGLSSVSLHMCQGGIALPALPGASPGRDIVMEAGDSPMPTSRVRQDAADWVANEATAWTSFAHSALTGKPLGSYEEETTQALRLAPAGVEERAGLSRTIQLKAGESLRSAQARDLGVPSLPREANRELTLDPAAAVKRIGGVVAKRSAYEQALGDHPEALMDIIDADRTGNPVANMRMATHDYRPNRQIKGSTRTARVVRRTGLANSTHHRDQVMTGMKATQMSQVKNEYVRKMAAERIQRHWRAYYKYCRENEGWMTTTWICATMIQTRWRSYHVRRIRLDAAATKIQRLTRGHIVRTSLRKHQAAVAIQRRAVGMITRNQLRKLHVVAMKINKLIRGFLARRRVAKKRAFMTKTAITLQCSIRAMIAKRRMRELRQARHAQQAREQAVRRIQRVFRGNQGRKGYASCRELYEKGRREFQAASKLQAMARRDAAIKRVDLMRDAMLLTMHQAATFMRKMWLGQKTRKRYMALREEFAAHEKHIICMQRHARGFLVRLRMWREAIRMEDELWGALEIQRVWRGYVGRVAYETKYEQVWRREMATAMIQRNLRGWLARTKVSRQRRRIARAEFERARLRFRSAQRVQALARGVLTRKVTSMHAARKTRAAIQLQRIWRGHALRKQLWGQVVLLRATMIQAVARGFLVRNRRFHLMAKVILVQRAFRRARQRPKSVKEKARAERKMRHDKAAVIQNKFREHRESQEVERIQQKS